MAKVYSARFIDLDNFSGTYTYTNDTGDLLVIRCVTVYFGGLTEEQFGLNGPSGGAWLQAALGPLSDAFVFWDEIRLVVELGESFNVACTNGMDIYVGGYALTLP